MSSGVALDNGTLGGFITHPGVVLAEGRKGAPMAP